MGTGVLLFTPFLQTVSPFMADAKYDQTRAVWAASFGSYSEDCLAHVGQPWPYFPNLWVPRPRCTGAFVGSHGQRAGHSLAQPR